MSLDANSPFDNLLGVVLEEAGPSRVVATLDAKPQHQQPFGLVHGGVYCTLVETVASIGGNAYSLGNDLGNAVGVSNTTDMLRSHTTGLLRAVATPIHQGRRQQLWQVEIHRDRDGALVARGQLRLQNLGPAAS